MTEWERLGGLTVRKFDWVDHLRDDEDVAAYLDAAYEWGDPEFITTCLAEVARAYGVAKLQRPSSDGAEALGDAIAALDAPQAAQILDLLRNFGLQMHSAEPIQTPTR